MDAGHEDRWQKGSSSDATILVFIDNIFRMFMISSNPSTNSSQPTAAYHIFGIEDVRNIHD